MLKKFIFISSLLLGLGHFTVSAGADMSPALKKRIGTPPFRVVREILSTNNSTTANTNIHQVQERTAPYLTWLADSDPRLSSAFILPGGLRMITIRNPGGQIAVSPGSLNYGIYQVHTPVLLITGVSDSHHVRYYLKGYQNLSSSLQMDLNHLHPALAKEAQIDLEQEKPAEKLLRLVETNVDYQVRKAAANYQERIRDGRLVVIGSVFDTTNHYGKGRNKLIITNVNGKKGKKLLETRLIRQLKPGLRRYVGPVSFEKR